MELTLGFSPCPNDTFIFDALVHQKIDTEGLTYKFHLADVEELNVNAFNQKADITKVSFSAFLQLIDNYFMLNSGAALGFGTGPLVISKSLTELSQLEGKKIAIPGIHTTANLLFSIAIQFPVVKKEILFSEIEQAVLSDDADAGLIIHESRFTYQQKGLKKLLDLGEYWENRTGLPVPLGGIAIHKRIDHNTALKVQRGIRKSVEYAWEHAPELPEFVSCHAAEMQPSVMQQHIDLYVNRFSSDLGFEGKNAVQTLFSEALQCGIINTIPSQIFL